MKELKIEETTIKYKKPRMGVAIVSVEGLPSNLHLRNPVFYWHYSRNNPAVYWSDRNNALTLHLSDGRIAIFRLGERVAISEEAFLNSIRSALIKFYEMRKATAKRHKKSFGDAEIHYDELWGRIFLRKVTGFPTVTNMADVPIDVMLEYAYGSPSCYLDEEIHTLCITTDKRQFTFDISVLLPYSIDPKHFKEALKHIGPALDRFKKMKGGKK